MGTFEEELKKTCVYCGGNNIREIAVNCPLEDDELRDNYNLRSFQCQYCGRCVHVSIRRPIYKPLEELKAERGEIALKLNALYNKYYDLRDRTMSPTKEMGIVKEHINKLRKELDKLDKKIDKVRRERKENE